MRRLFLLSVVLLLAGCGSSSASGGSSPTATPQRQTTFKHAPPMTIDRNAQYTATVRTTDGTFTITLLPKVAPLAVNNFVFLARHRFYDGIIFHRIIQYYMVQTGDPLGTGEGGPGYTFKDEKVHGRYTVGTVAMANSGPNTNGSQFFIVVGREALALPPKYTIFGKVTRGMQVVQHIAATPVGPSPSNPQEVSSPLTPVKMIRVTIQESK